MDTWLRFFEHPAVEATLDMTAWTSTKLHEILPVDLSAFRIQEIDTVVAPAKRSASLLRAVS